MTIHLDSVDDEIRVNYSFIESFGAESLSAHYFVDESKMRRQPSSCSADSWQVDYEWQHCRSEALALVAMM